ncbi:HVO_A0114 family putative DNA-binding protein [Methylomagnum sp.]
MKRIEIGVIDPKAEQARLLAWAARVDAGEAMPESTPGLNFSSEKQLLATFTEKRMELLRFIARNEGLNVRQIAQAIERDYKNVHADIGLLAELGLLEKRDGGVFAPYDDIVIHYVLREAA